MSMFSGSVIVVLDLEMTAWEGSVQHDWGRPGEYPEIIEIGAVKADLAAGGRELSVFERLVRPSRNPQLSDYVTALTGISQGELDTKGISFASALRDFVAFLGKDTCKICFNGGDDRILDINCRLNDIAELPFDHGLLLDLQPFFCRYLPGQGFRPSAKLLELAGLPNELTPHRGVADSRIVLSALCHLLALGKCI